MGSQIDEDLVMILNKKEVSPAVRLTGWEYVLGLTGSNEGLKKLLSFEKYIQTILHTAKDHQTVKTEVQIFNVVYKCLINISSFPDGALELMKTDNSFVQHLLNIICDQEFSPIESCCYILSNMSTHCDLVNTENLITAISTLWDTKLMSCFDSSNLEVRHKYRFLSLFFANISRQPEGRKFLLEKDSFIQVFLECCPETDHDVRRLGRAMVLRNCCSDTSYHQKLSELNILPSLLLPLMGPEEFEEEEMDKLPLVCQYLEDTKKRETIPVVRRALVQALSLLCYTEESWSLLKSKGVYFVIREYHKWEIDPDVIEAIETLVGYLLVDEYASPDTEADSSSAIIPAETDLLKDIPDLVLPC